MQALYAFELAGEGRVDVAERQLRRSFDKMHELYILQVSFILAVVEFARNRQEEAKKKFFPTEEDLNPNTRFVDNPLILAMEDNAAFTKECERYKVNWVDEKEMIRRIWIAFRDSQEMARYLSGSGDDPESHREILRVLVRDYMAPSEVLSHYFEGLNIHWADDFDTMLGLVLKTIRSLGSDEQDFPPALIHSEEDMDEMKEFILPLFRKTIAGGEEYERMIAGHARNWEFDRIALLDVILMKMAICELLHFPSIPVKVTINEYIEISKGYSTPKSRIFINGMLDKIVETLRADNRLRKTGRGLLDS